MDTKQIIKESAHLYFLPITGIWQGISMMSAEMARTENRFHEDKNFGRFFMGSVRIYFRPLTAAYNAWISRISNNERDEATGL